jgi:hypothetical protein
MRQRGWALFGVLAGACLLTGTGASTAENLRSGAGQGQTPRVSLARVGGGTYDVAPGRAPDVVGTLRYDNDIPFSRDGAVGVPVGNRFDNGVQDPHSIQKVTFRAAGCFQTPYPSFRLSIFDVNPTPMTNMNIAMFSGGGMCTGGTAGGVLRTAMLPAPIIGHVGPFIGALFNTAFAACLNNTMVNTTCEGVAISMGVVDPGMGFHAISVVNTMQTAQNLGTRNAIFRVTGDNLPVELMGFGVK